MSDCTLTGFRLVRFELGLVADLMFENPYTAQFYLMLEFRKGIAVTREFFAGDRPAQMVYLNNLNKIVKHKVGSDDEKNLTYVFTDNSSFSMGDDSA